VAVGVINMCANLAGLIGPAAVGEMRSAGTSDAGCVLFLAAGYATGAAVITTVSIRRQVTVDLPRRL
jgi:hypothetical protein